jgi:hypothetical protein
MAAGPERPLPKKVADTGIKARRTYPNDGPLKRGHVILDIDETFVQYVGNDDWATLEASGEAAKYEIHKMKPTADGLFILRPYAGEFFSFLAAHCETVNLWTLSDQEYADGVKKMIRDKFGVDIKYAWSEDHNEPAKEKHGNNKDLNWLWYDNKATKGVFKPCNTILIDDLLQNTQNPSNYLNGIRIPAFAPLGHKITAAEGKTKTHIRTNEYTDLSTDTTLLEVTEELTNIFKNKDWCREGDMPYPLTQRIDLTMAGGRRKTRRRKPLRKTRKVARKTKTRR